MKNIKDGGSVRLVCCSHTVPTYQISSTELQAHSDGKGKCGGQLVKLKASLVFQGLSGPTWVRFILICFLAVQGLCQPLTGACFHLVLSVFNPVTAPTLPAHERNKSLEPLASGMHLLLPLCYT